ncbi:MAG: hydroxyphenylacetyl-CoA thioesterase PaaI [Candidatus Saccharibacteria bacterium]
MNYLEELKSKFETEDLFRKLLGIELLELEPGFARLSMTVTESMANFHGTGHGGAVFTLADTAFAMACNAHGVPAVALTVNIDYFAPAKIGETLIATAEEVNRTRRTGHYHITVTNESGNKVVFFRGIAYFKA